jgi:hypothetical protein
MANATLEVSPVVKAGANSLLLVNSCPQIPSEQLADIQSYMPENGWKLMQGDNPKDGQYQSPDFQLNYEGIQAIRVTKTEFKDFDPSEYLIITFVKRRAEECIKEGVIPFFNVTTRITPNSNEKTNNLEISWAATTFLSGLLYHEHPRHAHGLMTAKEGKKKSVTFVNHRAVNPTTGQTYRYDTPILDRKDIAGFQGAIATLQHKCGFPVNPYPLPVVS